MRSPHILMLIVVAFFLGACSVRSDAAELYKKEAPVQIEIVMPKTIHIGEPVKVQAVLMQEERKLEKADFVHFELLKQDGSTLYPMEEALELGDGVYQMVVDFDKDGIYYLDVHAGNNGAISSPRHQFIVGSLSEHELEKLVEDPVKEQGSSGHHH